MRLTSATTLPDDRQNQSNAHLTADQREEVRRRLADPDPAFASGDEVDAAYRSSTDNPRS